MNNVATMKIIESIDDLIKYELLMNIFEEGISKIKNSILQGRT